MATKTIRTGVSSTKAAAATKKSRLLADIRNGKRGKAEVAAIRGVDPLLAEVMSLEDIDNAESGGGRFISIEIEVED